MVGFDRKGLNSVENFMSASMVALKKQLDAFEYARVERILRAWNFYRGYHWEDIPPRESSELTYNYCKAFVNKFVAFELGKAFTFAVHRSMQGFKADPDKGIEEVKAPEVTSDGRSLFEFLEDVWEDNNQYKLITEIGQMKSITGDAWVRVNFVSPEDMEEEGDDPFGQYPDGRIEILLMPSSVVYPKFDPHRRGKLLSVTIMYTYEAERVSPLFGRTRKETVTFKQEWTAKEVITDDGINPPETLPNKYNIIPFVQITNFSSADSNYGISDLEDIVPMNVEFNLKKSNVSDILDYHAAPVTIVYGAKVGNLEKGANKMWGGLAKDAKVENLELKGDLSASSGYTADLKLSMCEVAGVPQTVLGGAPSISNTSGVALQYLNLPLIEKTNVKRANTENGLEALNRLIILIASLEGMVKKPESVPARDFFYSEVEIPDTLPKDTMIELQTLQQEMKMGIESRRGAMKRLGKENIEEILAQVSKDIEENPTFYGQQQPQLNSGMMNGQTPVEQVRKEMTGANGESK